MASHLISDSGRHNLSTEAIGRDCFHCVMKAAHDRCIERGEPERWGSSAVAQHLLRQAIEQLEKGASIKRWVVSTPRFGSGDAVSATR